MNENLFNKQLGARLRTLRQIYGYTQSDISGILKCTFQQIQKYEKGNDRISLYKLTVLSELFKVSVGDMLNNYVETLEFEKNKIDEFKKNITKLLKDI